MKTYRVRLSIQAPGINLAHAHREVEMSAESAAQALQLVLSTVPPETDARHLSVHVSLVLPREPGRFPNQPQ